MAMANRKLQTEIERTLKKVQEGVEIFDALYNKVYAAPTPQQKEKHEADLKKEIKKLQRYRDQIKTWAASNDIKDKTALLEARRIIELDMERFKVCEKETKTKAYSKEGLAQATKKDPAEEARDAAREWLETSIQSIEEQKEAVEAELESIGGGKKKKSAPSQREDELKEKMETHVFHTTNLEQLLRLLENESIGPADVDDIKDGVEYYVESNDDPDFYDDDTIYDDIKALAEVKENPDSTIAVAGVVEKEEEEEPPPPPPKKPEPEPEKPKKEEEKKEEKKKQPNPREALPIPLPTPLPQPNTQQQAQARAQAQAQAQARAQAHAQAQALALAQAQAQARAQAGQQPGATGMQQTGTGFGDMKRNFEQQQQRPPQPMPKPAARPEVEDGAAGEARRGSLEPPEDLVDDTVTPTGGEGGDEDKISPVQMLEASFRNIPDASDSERPKIYMPRNPYPTHAAFPDKPLPLFEANDNASMFEKLDIDTLFFIFYYQQGTYQQYLAARELKKQSWRFHKKYMTWFQRHEEPKVTTDEYEQGTYVYFDFETGWCQRIKSEFTFEYSYLEDELQV